MYLSMNDSELLKKHEPVLRFAKSERFFPMAVEPYLEKCTLHPSGPQGVVGLLSHPNGTLITRIGKLESGEYYLRFVNEPLIEYGSHTHLHYNLEFLNSETCLEELTKSKKTIEDCIQKSIISLAFPDGSYKTETIANCKKAGYENVVAVTYKLNEQNNDPYILSRFTISNSTTFESNIIRLVMQFDKFGF